MGVSGLNPRVAMYQVRTDERKYHKYESRKIFNNEVIIPGHITCICTIHLYIDLKKKYMIQYAENVGQIDYFRLMVFFFDIQNKTDTLYIWC